MVVGVALLVGVTLVVEIPEVLLSGWGSCGCTG